MMVCLWGINYFAQGGNAYTDTLAFHFYPAFCSANPLPAERALVDAERYRNLAATFRISEVWNGEGGYVIGTISDAAQAGYVIKSIANLHGARLYNAASSFNGCNSATNLIWESHIPANTSDAGFVVNLSNGVACSAGISICVNGACGQTNTTAATASAISLDVQYR